MRRFSVLVRKEIGGIFLNAPILFATAFFVLLNSFGFYFVALRAGGNAAAFEHVANFMLYTSLILFPFVARHSFSADIANGTMETLLTAPISRTAVVLAKYAACMAFVAVYLLHGAVYALLLSYAGNIDWRSVAAALLALLAVGSVAMALGVFVSALTPSPAAAAGGAIGVLVLLVVAADLDPYSGNIPDILHAASFVPHAKRWIDGLVETQGMVYFVTATALFLFYAWLAISTQEPERPAPNPTVKRRLAVTYLLVVAGVALLLLQAALLNIEGYWEAGTPLGHNLFRVPRTRFIPLALAAGVFAWSLFTHRAARRAKKQDARARNAKYATITESQVHRAPRYYYKENVRARRRAALAAVAALAIAVNLNWLAHYPFQTFADGGRLAFLARLQAKSWDVSGERKNSLSATTLRALDNLQGKLQVYSFLPEDLLVNNVPVAHDMRALLARYSDNNALVSTVHADSANEPGLVRELAQELGLAPEDAKDSVIAAYQGRHMILPASGLVAAPEHRQRAPADARRVFDGEDRLTQAILHLLDPRVPNIFFTYGHLEHSLSAGAAPERSVSRLVRALSGANFRVRQFSFASPGPIPADCDVLAVVAPRTPFKDADAREIERYLDNGGSLVVFAPPPGPDVVLKDDPLNDLLFRLGGSFRDDSISDDRHNDLGQPASVLARQTPGSPEAYHLVFPNARSIRDNPRARDDGWQTDRRFQTYPSAVARPVPPETDHEPLDGPFTLLYRSTRETENGQARAVAVASGALAANADIGRGLNLGLVRANVQWLAGLEETSGIEPRRWVDRRLRLTGPQYRAFMWISLIAMPLFWLLAGISVWWLRRE